MSDQGTKDYVKAMDLKILENIGIAANVAIIVSPVGPVAVIAGMTGSVAGFTAGVIEGDVTEAVASSVIQYGAGKYLREVYKLSVPTAERTVAAIDLVGGWDAFVKRTNEGLGNRGRI